MSMQKFDTASLFDPENEEWIKITPAGFVEDIHGGRLECPSENCHGALSYVSGHHARGSLTYRPEHFRTNTHGEPHNANCLYNPEPASATRLRMQEALAAGKYILLNINFSTSFNLEKGRLRDRFARSAMGQWNGFLRKDWIAANGKKANGEKLYESFSGFSLEKLSQDLRAFSLAKQSLPDVGTERLMISYLHGVIPWSQFYINNAVTGSVSTQKPSFTIPDLFDRLKSGFDKSPQPNRLWAAAPALRMDLELFLKSRASSSGGLYTNFNRTRNSVEIDNHTYILHDVIQPKGNAVRELLQSARNISLVSTPYLLCDNVNQAISQKTDKIHINWPVVSPNQLILK